MENLQPEKYRHDLEVVRNTAAQVAKDFGIVGVDVLFSGNPETAYEELQSQITPALTGLYKLNQSAFMALLYRIDVSEIKVKNLEKTTRGTDFFNGLAALILEREFLKVLIRKLFSNRNG